MATWQKPHTGSYPALQTWNPLGSMSLLHHALRKASELQSLRASEPQSLRACHPKIPRSICSQGLGATQRRSFPRCPARGFEYFGDAFAKDSLGRKLTRVPGYHFLGSKNENFELSNELLGEMFTTFRNFRSQIDRNAWQLFQRLALQNSISGFMGRSPARSRRA